MQLFPIGTINNSDSTATLDTTGQTFTLFEPNQECNSHTIYPTLKTTYENQILVTRRKALPYLTVNYRYSNIWNREYKNIEHFVDKIEGELNTFYIADFSTGETPSNVVDNGTNWTISVGRTRIYSSVTNQRSNYGIVWDGINKFRIGAISTVTAGTSIVMAETYGDLSATNAKTDGMLYPLYQVYFVTNPLPNFKPGVFIKDTVATAEIGGFMRSGDIAFVSKYKV